ncbi:MAG: class I SAM-dependent methyltransferase [Saprospiraceae bacterium]|nr:class I SAM-dependent methyltransferase [Saprospiraceae bacterium]
MWHNIARRALHSIRELRYPGAVKYWEKRYADGGDSGPGSVGRLAAYKAETVNRFVREHNIFDVIDFGCGDGKQLLLADYPTYTGLDISASAVAQCRELFREDTTKRFEVYRPEKFEPAPYQADMALSMEAIFHLTETHLYNRYMQHLFATARKWVLIFSSDTDDPPGGPFPHFRSRCFSSDVPQGWELRKRLDNPHGDISISSFFFYEKRAF